MYRTNSLNTFKQNKIIYMHAKIRELIRTLDFYICALFVRNFFI